MSKNLRLTILFIAFLLLSGYFSIAWYFSNRILIPYRELPDQAHPQIVWSNRTDSTLLENHLPVPQEFSVQTHDDLTLKGWYFKRANPAKCGVVLLHGWGNTRSDMLKYADIFWDCGCDLIAYDHRAHSESEGEYATGGIKEKGDLIQVTEWLQQQTGLRKRQIGWMGASWGAATALQAGAIENDMAFIVADSPFEDWHAAIFERAKRLYGPWVSYVSPGVMWIVDMRAGIDHKAASSLKAASDMDIPVLLIHSQTDEATASQQSVRIAAQLPAGHHVFHHTNWGAGHTKDVDVRPEAFRDLVYDFMQRYVADFGECSPAATASAVIRSTPWR